MKNDDSREYIYKARVDRIEAGCEITKEESVIARDKLAAKAKLEAKFPGAKVHTPVQFVSIQ